MDSMPNKPPPQLPQGNSGIWQGISENFAFHSSPESFIATRLSQLQKQDPEFLNRRPVVRAKILNRNVAIVSSYAHVKAVLEGDEGGKGSEDDMPACVAGAAYDDLMRQFFPAPNLLLADGCPHARMRQRWDGKMQDAQLQLEERARMIIHEFITQISLLHQMDLYANMKALAWQVLLGCFLGIYSDDPLFVTVQRLQEDLLRGQFSLMPVSINTGFWKSPRKHGIDARKSLQDLISQRLVSSSQRGEHIAFGLSETDDKAEEVNHILMSTSSLAAKGLASLLTAYMLNIFLHGDQDNSLYRTVSQAQDSKERRRVLASVYLETERLSPPIVGVMRRVTKDVILPSDANDADVLVPAGWDVWLYIIGATRDRAAYDEDAESFQPDRYLQNNVPPPLGFGIGPKSCLGRELMRLVSVLFVEQLLAKGLRISGNVNEPGLKGWLGWITADPESWAAGMKQLPTQHPTHPVLVEFQQA